MDLLPSLVGAFITGLISISTAFIILKLQEWRNKKRVFKAFYSEVESNLSTVKKLLPLAESLGKTVKSVVTKFDLQNLYIASYEELRRLGYLLSLNEKVRALTEEVYGLISCHNNQTNELMNQQFNFSNPKALMLSMIPRLGGYKERLEELVQKLGVLKEELKSHI